MIRLGKFDKWGYKNSFSKSELARELVYMHQDCDSLKQENQKLKEKIDKIQSIANYEYDFYDSAEELMEDIRKILGILSEVE